MPQPSAAAQFWNARYHGEDYVYGREANDFLRAQASLLSAGDKVLCLAEGEGRNSVFLAQQDCDVRGVDFSAEGKSKALKLAQDNHVQIAYDVADLSLYDLGDQQWDAVVSIFCHPPEAVRRSLYTRIRRALKPGGIFILESYNKSQLAHGTGGPQDAALLVNLDDLIAAFDGFEILRAQDLERPIHEGAHHNGPSAVSQFIARRPV